LTTPGPCLTMPRPLETAYVAKNLTPKTTILDAKQMARIIRRMAGEIVERDRDFPAMLLVGIRTRGVPLAEALAAEIERMEGHKVPLGILDITLYRDDLTTIAANPVVKPTKLPEPIDDKVVVLVDDVLYTGRTVRAALDALIDFGRPKKVMLAVLVDRGHRELPIHADVIGKTVPTDANEVVKVKLVETDDEDEVLIMEK
jgi:pyrimidine operon attenuation protein / uracil phosphoribosyltransferase